MKKRTTKKTSGKTGATKKGFDIVPGQSEAVENIKARMGRTSEKLLESDMECRVYTHEYSNGEVDSELAIVIERGTTSIEVSQAIEEAFGTIADGLGTQYWFSLGCRMSIHQDEAEDRSGSARYRGMDDLQMYWRRVNKTNLIDSFLRQQKIMLPGVEEKYRRKVEIVFIRLHWNPENEKPKR